MTTTTTITSVYSQLKSLCSLLSLQPPARVLSDGTLTWWVTLGQIRNRTRAGKQAEYPRGKGGPLYEYYKHSRHVTAVTRYSRVLTNVHIRRHAPGSHRE